MTDRYAFAPHLLPGLLMGLLLAGCTTSRPTLHDLDYPGTLQPPATLPIEVFWQQTVTASWRQPDKEELQQRSFAAAIQRYGDELTVIGMSPMGSRAFTIRQTNDGIDVENLMPEQMQIPPRFILLDVQRAFFPWFPEQASAGARVMRTPDEEIGEAFEHGRLLERTFTRREGEPEGVITIRYEYGEPDWHAPSRVVLENGWFGYTLTIETTAEQRLSD